MASATSTLLPPTRAALASGLVVFDLEGTIVDRSIVEQLDKALARAGITRRRDPLLRTVIAGLRSDRTVGSHQLQALRAAQVRALAGADARVVQSVFDSVARRVAADVRPATRELIASHLDAGDTVALTSSAPHEFVSAVAASLDAAIVGVGTPVGIADGHYTGHVRGRYCLGSGLVERLMQELGPRDLSTATVYADSVTDLPLLRLCASPIAVNPDGALRIVATTHGWPVWDMSAREEVSRSGPTSRPQRRSVRVA